MSAVFSVSGSDKSAWTVGLEWLNQRPNRSACTLIGTKYGFPKIVPSWLPLFIFSILSVQNASGKIWVVLLIFTFHVSVGKKILGSLPSAWKIVPYLLFFTIVPPDVHFAPFNASRKSSMVIFINSEFSAKCLFKTLANLFAESTSFNMILLEVYNGALPVKSRKLCTKWIVIVESVCGKSATTGTAEPDVTLPVSSSFKSYPVIVATAGVFATSSFCLYALESCVNFST